MASGPRSPTTFVWQKKWDKVLDYSFEGNVYIKWFINGKTNISVNALDRHLEKRGDQVALIWEGNSPDEHTKLTYKQLHTEVCKFANVLKSLGVKKGDRVCMYMQMIPELPIAMLACARIGAIHSVVFGAFSEDSLRDRIQDSECKIVITQDTALRGNKNDIAMKTKADTAVAECPSIKKIVVVKRTGLDVPMQAGRDVWWHEAMEKADAKCDPEWMDAEDPLFILYTSGSTGKPKGVLHTTGGYMVYAATTFKYIFDYHDGDIWWCTADIGWITGHSYIVYGPLCDGRHERHVRGRADLSRCGPFLGRGRQVQGHAVLHRADGHPGADAPRRGADQLRATCPASSCWVRWASRSIPKCGCGTGGTSARSAARSSTRGGRRKRAAF